MKPSSTESMAWSGSIRPRFSRGDSPQMALVGINPAVGQVSFADTRGKNLGSDQEHRLAHLVSFGEDCPQADSRKDVNVVGLADVADRSAELERAEGTARGHDGPSVRPVQGLV